MSILDKNGKIFGKINIVDFVVGSAITLGVLGVFLVQSGTHITSGNVVEGEKDIAIVVQLPMLRTLDKNLFVAGDKTSITIRNQPRGEVLIQKVEVNPVTITESSVGSHHVASYPDPSQPNSYDFTMTLKDHAKVTKEGYVTEGVKVKVGLPIELEGFKYRVYGKIIDVEAM
jgi:Domain of unknown function (DUF4330)